MRNPQVPNSTTTASKSEISRSDIISKGVNSGLPNPTKKMKKSKYLNVSSALIPPLKSVGIPADKDKEFSKILDRVPIHLITSDFALYEAISSIQKEELVLSALSKFLFRVQIVSSPKITISMDRIDHLRDVAKLKKFGGNRI